MAEPSFRRMAVVLLPFSIFGIIQGLMSSMVMAAELPLLTPDAADWLATVTAIEAAAQLCGPIIGAFIDKYENGDRIAKTVGAVGMTAGISLIIVAVHIRGEEGLTLYVVGMCLLMTSNVGPMVTAFSGVLASFVAARRDCASKIASIASVYGLIGTIMATATVGYLLPITEDAHGFYWYMLAWIVLMDVLLLFVDTSRSPPPAEAEAPPSVSAKGVADPRRAAQLSSLSMGASLSLTNSAALSPAQLVAQIGSAKVRSDDEAASDAPTAAAKQFEQQQQEHLLLPGASSFLALVRDWLCSTPYRAFRLVLGGRLVAVASIQVIGLNFQFMMEDRLSLAGVEALQLNATVRFVMLGVGLASVVPIGLLADKIGPPVCVAFALVMYAAVLVAFPLADQVGIFVACMAAIGLGGQFYSVADTALIITSMPDPSNQARDFGLYNGFGSGIGAMFASLLNPHLLGEPMANTTAADEEDGDVRPPFAPENYQRALWPWAALCLLMVPCIGVAGYLLRGKFKACKQPVEEHTPKLIGHNSEKANEMHGEI